MPSSFKRGADLAPIRYRTPSPPKYAFEPISPVLTGTAADELQHADITGLRNGTLKRPSFSHDHSNVSVRKQDYLLGGSMDAFASIALATKSSGPHRPSTSNGVQVLSDESLDTDRPSKRARSEKSPLPDRLWTMTAANTRPATNNEHSPESRRFEAELLLNFAHEAAKLVCSPQQSPQIARHLSLNASRPTSDILLKPTLPYPEERAKGFIEGKALSTANNVDPAGVWMPSREAGAFDEKRHASEADHRQETYLDQRISNDLTSELSHTNFDRSAFEAKHLSPTPTTQQGDPDVTPTSEKDARNTRIGTVEWSEVEDDGGSLGGAVFHELHKEIEAVDQFNGSLAEVNDDQRKDIARDQQHAPSDPLPEDATQLMEDGIQSLEDAVQVLEGQEDATIVKPGDSEVVDALEKPEEEVLGNESRTMHGFLGNHAGTNDEKFAAEVENTAQSTLEVCAVSTSARDVSVAEGLSRPTVATVAVCASCNFSRNSPAIESENNATSWISCDGCKAWFHFACAGFKNDREVRSVDKYRCRKCKPMYGATTYVRKSSRAHSAIDYAGLHQGVIKTSDERPEHHYIKPIKDGTITFLAENFARMRPELVTSDYFEKGTGMREPIIVPASFNPRPKKDGNPNVQETRQSNDESSPDPFEDNGVAEDWFSRHTEPEVVLDQGQDALDMVIPQGLTVRRVAELYGQDEKVEVIDVKSQNGENKKWNMRRWADYYENPNNKVVRNVISLEVSQSRLGRLIRRPQIVRDLDLQDSVWPEELLAKGEYPRVQFYCLMSVADCFTDFHIDFGGSSVFYHILKGKKTFLFIPPKEKHLKKYEEWCMSPAQNWTFLGDQTKECYRVDLSEGDTMLIPAGWIHAVWTPEDSLVIGGNFLTRLNFGMQLRVAQVEKATGVARKFRYPHFQKLHWYTALRYLEDDPLPRNVKELLHAGGTFVRQQPAHNEFDSWGENSRPGVENYHTRYYSQAELDGLPDLTRYLLRTALIDIGSITDGISVETRNAVKKSIPRGHGEPLDVLKTFAAWCAWKRGNESIPHWAYPDAELETLVPDKLSVAAMKKLDREAALQAPRRQSARMQSLQAASEVLPGSAGGAAPSFAHGQNGAADFSVVKKARTSSVGTNATSHRKTACESCRKRRRACKHKDQVASSVSSPPQFDMLGNVSTDPDTALQNPISSLGLGPNDGQDSKLLITSDSKNSGPNNGNLAFAPEPSPTAQVNDGSAYQRDDLASQPNPSLERAVSDFAKIEEPISSTIKASHGAVSGNTILVRPRHKACNECRKSKVSLVSVIPLNRVVLMHVQRRCIHDAYGNEDPVKVRESAIPRPHARKSNALMKDTSTPRKHVQGAVRKRNLDQQRPTPSRSEFEEQIRRPAPIANMIARRASPLPDNLLQAPFSEPLPLDPALFNDNANSIPHDEQASVSSNFQQSISPSTELHAGDTKELLDTVADQWQITGSCPAPDIDVGTATLESSESFEPPASSLVSPPASSHDDAGISLINAHAGWESSTISSRHSSSQPKQMQRYTPESGSMRRASSSSYGENLQEQPGPSILAELSSDQKPKVKAISENMADEDSMKLIKELQAEEYGLRRRGKA